MPTVPRGDPAESWQQPARRLWAFRGAAGNYVVVGAHLNDAIGNGAVVGIAYVFDLGSATPTVPTGPYIIRGAGWRSVWFFRGAISRQRVVIGGPAMTPVRTMRSAYIYELGGPTPTIAVASLRNPTPAVLTISAPPSPSRAAASSSEHHTKMTAQAGRRRLRLRSH